MEVPHATLEHTNRQKLSRIPMHGQRVPPSDAEACCAANNIGRGLTSAMAMKKV